MLEAGESQVSAPDAHWEIRATRALYESQSGDHRAALALLEGCPDVNGLGLRAHSQIALVRAFALPGVGRGQDALAEIDEAMQRRTADGEVLTMYTVGLLAAARAMALVGLGRLAEAGEIAAFGYDAAVGSGERSSQGFFANVRGWVDLHSGQLAGAIRFYREGAVSFRAQRHRGPTRWSLAGVLFGAGLARDREVAAEAQRSLDELGPHPAGLFDVALGRARAWAAMAADEPGQARAELATATELARQRELPGEEAACLHDRVRLGEAADVAARLAELAGRCQGDLVTAMAAHAAGLVAGDSEALERVAERFAVMGFLLKAAEAAMGASEAAAKAGDQRRATRLAHSRHRAGRPVRDAGDADAHEPRRAGPAHEPRARGGDPGRVRADEPGHRRAPVPVGPHRRQPPGPHLRQVGRFQPSRPPSSVGLQCAWTVDVITSIGPAGFSTATFSPMRKLLVPVVAVFALLMAATPGGAVTYGELDAGEHPYVGFAIFFVPSEPGWFSCSGTLLDADTFLTAGHCVFDVGTDGAETPARRPAAATTLGHLRRRRPRRRVARLAGTGRLSPTRPTLYAARSAWLNDPANGFTKGIAIHHPRLRRLRRLPGHPRRRRRRARHRRAHGELRRLGTRSARVDDARRVDRSRPQRRHRRDRRLRHPVRAAPPDGRRRPATSRPRGSSR